MMFVSQHLVDAMNINNMSTEYDHQHLKYAN